MSNYLLHIGVVKEKKERKMKNKLIYEIIDQNGYVITDGYTFRDAYYDAQRYLCSVLKDEGEVMDLTDTFVVRRHNAEANSEKERQIEINYWFDGFDDPSEHSTYW